MNRIIQALRAVRLVEKSFTGQMNLPKNSTLVFVPFSRQNARNFSQQTAKTENPKDAVKLRRMYALGGCLIFMWISTHGILLWRRRSEHRELDEKMPPIPFEDFAVKFISSGLVKSIVFQPQFGTGNVYLLSGKEQTMKQTVSQMFHISPPDKFARPPDARFYFEGDQKELEKAVLEAQKTISHAGGQVNEIELTMDQFPSYRELGFIAASTFFTLIAMTVIK